MNTSELELFPDDHFNPRPAGWKTTVFWARVVLLLLLLNILRDIAAYFQVHYMLTSAVIPHSIVYTIALPFLLSALCLAGLSILILILYFLEKNRLVIILGCLALVAQFGYLTLSRG